jgi:hypothetical protein
MLKGEIATLERGGKVNALLLNKFFITLFVYFITSTQVINKKSHKE